jgi:hypothetical protein
LPYFSAEHFGVLLAQTGNFATGGSLIVWKASSSGGGLFGRLALARVEALLNFQEICAGSLAPDFTPLDKAYSFSETISP